MNTDVHEYVSKVSVHVLYTCISPKAREFYSTATSRFLTYRGGVCNALTAISEGTLYIRPAKLKTVQGPHLRKTTCRGPHAIAVVM